MSAVDNICALVEDPVGKANSTSGPVIPDSLVDELLKMWDELEAEVETAWSACQDDIFYNYDDYGEPGSSYENTINDLAAAANSLRKRIATEELST